MDDVDRRVERGAGLCASCAHARRVTSARGSVFVLCGRSVSDARYPKYPPLPVVRCDGHERRDGSAAGASD